MGKKKGFNWRARQVVNAVIDDSKTQKIQIDSNYFENTNYDACNSLVLPSKKGQTIIKKKNVTVTKLLSKSKRKQLEKIVERKQKKENRAALLEALSAVQVNKTELDQLTSISTIQTKGLRKFKNQLNSFNANISNTADDTKNWKINSIKGSFKRKFIKNDDSNKKFKSNDPNIVGLESSDDDSDESRDEIDTSVIENKINGPVIDDIPQSNSKPLHLNESKTNEINTENKLNHQNVPVDNIPSVKLEPKPAVFVHVNRKPEIQAARLELPILAEEQIIMETINKNSITIIAGETGSGKTTQVPQFLYEAGYAVDKLIGITEPRRIAAISMSKRVAYEMNLDSNVVSYLIRFEGNTTEQTKIKFMTDGVLLKEIGRDFLLTKYSVIILDEAHERSVNTDILIGFLSRIVPLRHKKGDPLKLIIMSATLRIEDFTENKRLFKITPPVLKVESRQFSVTVHFNKRTAANYLLEAFKKAVKVHNRLPAGGILIFVTGQREVNWLVRKLRRTFPLKFNKNKSENNKSTTDTSNSDSDDDEWYSKKTSSPNKRVKKSIQLPEVNLDDYSLREEAEEIVSGSELDDDSADDNDYDSEFTKKSETLWTLPLYSLLSSAKQAKVFKSPPEGCRLCVVATNVAETSLTIPNIKYVIDSGRVQVRLYDKLTGVSTHQVTWISKAAANQRAGRAGRTSSGHCYRLYSSAVFNDTFKDFSIPEIQQKPLDDLYLQMKCMNFSKIINFPFPTAPNILQLQMAEKHLIKIGALEVVNANKPPIVTPLGRAISKFPVLPRFGKMLALSHQYDLLPYTICMVAALSVPEVLLEVPIFKQDENTMKEIRQKWIQTRRSWAGTGNSLLLGDPMVLLKAVGGAEYANSEGELEKFCNDYGLRIKAVIEIRKLRIQLTNEIRANTGNSDLVVDPKMPPPSDINAKLLRQILLSGMPDQVAKKMDLTQIKEINEKAKYKYAYQCSELEEPVFLHSNSVLRNTTPEWVVYQEIYETNKMYMRGVTAVEPEWLPIYADKMCNLSEPLSSPEPTYNEQSDQMYCTVNGSFGKQNWMLPLVEVPLVAESYAKYKWFAKFILEGKVFTKLKKFVSTLLSQPGTMVKTWANLQPRTNFLLKTLMSRKAACRSDILKIWETEPDYLLAAYQKWLPISVHNEVALIWPPKN